VKKLPGRFVFPTAALVHHGKSVERKGYRSYARDIQIKSLAVIITRDGGRGIRDRRVAGAGIVARGR